MASKPQPQRRGQQNVIAVDVPSGQNRDVRASVGLLEGSRIVFTDLKIKKDPSPANLSEQRGRIAKAVMELAQAQQRPAALRINLRAPDETGGAGRRELEALITAGLSGRGPLKFAVPSRDLEILSPALRYARTRGHWADAAIDQLAMINVISNGSVSVGSVVTVLPRRISWRFTVTEQPSALHAGLEHLLERVKAGRPLSRLGVWSNLSLIQGLLSGASFAPGKEVRDLIVAASTERKQRDMELIPAEVKEDALIQLSHELTIQAYRQYVQGRLRPGERSFVTPMPKTASQETP